MKKLLVWHSYKLEPKGGPRGYLYNLHKYIRENHIEGIDFLGDILDVTLLQSRYSDLLLKIAKKGLPPYRSIMELQLYINHAFRKYEVDFDVDFNQYDYIHFHTPYELVKFSRSFAYHGKKVLTTHSPKPPFMELVEDIYPVKNEKFFRDYRDKLMMIDTEAFEQADMLVYPCKEALDGYGDWGYYDHIFSKDIRYIPTGIEAGKIKSEISRDTVLETYGIPKESLVISYVGRHNDTKGYDLLKVFAKELLQRYKNVYFLIGGKEFPLKGLQSERWIEVGWTNDPFSLINASDLFVLPNKISFFDLVLLEVMGLNKPVLLSDIGGNKFFKQYDLDLFYFSLSVESMMQAFERYGNTELKGNNRTFIQEKLSTKRFVENYVQSFDLK